MATERLLLHQEGQPLPSERFRIAIADGVSLALNEMATHMAHADPLYNLPFHERPHAESFIARGLRVLTTIHALDPQLVTKRDLLLFQLVGAFHDIVQEQKVEGSPLKRTLLRGTNEQKSAQAALTYMDSVNEHYEGTFTNRDKAIVEEAILATIPEWDDTLHTVYQPRVNSLTTLVTFAAALADINGFGLEGASAAENDSDKLFLECNPDITDAFLHAPLSPQEAHVYASRAISFLDEQDLFIKGRRTLLQNELLLVPNPTTRKAVAGLFSHFDEASACIAQLKEHRSHMTDLDVLQEVGFRQTVRRD